MASVPDRLRRPKKPREKWGCSWEYRCYKVRQTLIALFELLVIENLDGDCGRLMNHSGHWHHNLSVFEGAINLAFSHIKMFIPCRTQRLLKDGSGVSLLPIHCQNRKWVW